MSQPMGDHDGRRLRAERSRDAVADAMLELLREGTARPQAVDIAARAGVSVRTVFRHYQDLDQLFAAAADRQAAHLAPLLDRPPAEGPLDERIAQFAARRRDFFEEIAAVRLAALPRAGTHPPVREALIRVNAALRRKVEEQFAEELGRCGPADRAELLAAADAATSWGSWDHLRNDQGLDPEAATAVVQRLLRGLFVSG